MKWHTLWGIPLDNTVHKIETRRPAVLPQEKELKEHLTGILQEFNVEHLQNLLHGLFGIGKGEKHKPRAVLAAEAAAALCFTDIEPFNAWFYSLPPLTRGILWCASFEEYVSAKHIEERFGVSVVQRKHKYASPFAWAFNKETNLDFLFLIQTHGRPIIAMPYYLQVTLKPWFVPPPAASLEYCLSEDSARQNDAVYDNSIAIAESLPLFCGRLAAILGGMGAEEKGRVLRGFKKRPIADLHRASAFLPFPLGADYAPSSADLAARFILLMNNQRVSRPENPYAEIKNLITQFFSKETRFHHQWHTTDRNFLEWSLLIDHLSKTPGFNLDEDKRLPKSRTILKEALYTIAEDGRTFDAAKLADYLTYNWDSFSFCHENYEKTLKLRADTLAVGGLAYTYDGCTEFKPTQYFRRDLLVKPVFKAYLYLFASLGLLAITQKEPPLVRTLKGKNLPLSPYDSLATVRITDLGRWCLGLTDKQPSLGGQQYEAIADRELFLVTARGTSLERKVYLDRIGRKLGEDRWRISAGSFIAGCACREEIEERVASFKRLIDPKPGAHWEALFQRVCSRAGLFDTKRNDVHVYTLPGDRALREELLADPQFKTMAMRCGEDLLVVPVKKLKPFTAFLAEHGIAVFP